jgi:NADH:ubiquinone oxidoreductase subunit C
MIMKLPGSSEELKREGMILHTCVGSYAEKVARGETMIIFIRQKTEPDEPYYTMEWKNNQIIQVRGKCNRDAPPKVQAFTKVFQAAMLNTATA